MRLKIGFILRSLLVVGSFLGLVVLWSSLSPRLDDPSRQSRMRVSDTPAPSGGGDLQLVLFARASGGSRGRRGRERRWHRSSAGGAGAARADPGQRAPRTQSPPPARPLAAPSSCASPPRAPLPLPALRLRVPATTHAGTAGRSGRRSGSLVRCGGSAAAQPRIPRCWDRRGRGPGTRGGSRLRPVARAGLKEARCRRCHHRSGQGPSVQPFLPCRRSGGAHSPGLPSPPARPPGCGREMAPRLRLLGRAPPPRQLRWPRDGVRCAAKASP